jgi:ammonium transporter, Amt family
VTSMNIAAVLGAGILALVMQSGFALVGMGLCRAKNAAHTISMGLLIGALCALAFWAYGFALGWGNSQMGPVAGGWRAALGAEEPILDRGVGLVVDSQRPSGFRFALLGWKGFFLSGVSNESVLVWFFWTMVLLATTAAIPIGTLAERWRWKNFSLYGLWVAAPFAIVSNWTWGGGWLAASGTNWRLGHGVVDFAGSGVVHVTGGMIGLAGAILLGPRIGKYLKGKPVPFPAHQVPMVVLGTLILAFGWLGYNVGWAVVGDNVRAGVVVVNTLLAGAAGALAAMVALNAMHMKPEPSMLCSGLLAGLVAISAPCAFVDSWAALVIGGAAGVLVVFSVIFWEVRGIDDPTGAISTHGVCGLWGLVAVGLFANGRYGAGWNGVAREAFQSQYGQDGVRGLFYGDASQLVAQLLGAAVIAAVGFVLATILFRLTAKIVPMRVSAETEYEGLDVPEMGARGYPDFTVTSRG